LEAERPADADTDRVSVVLKGPRRSKPSLVRDLDEMLAAAHRRGGLSHASCHEPKDPTPLTFSL
jgi:hypothetical protein